MQRYQTRTQPFENTMKLTEYKANFQNHWYVRNATNHLDRDVTSSIRRKIHIIITVNKEFH